MNDKNHKILVSTLKHKSYDEILGSFFYAESYPTIDLSDRDRTLVYFSTADEFYDSKDKDSKNTLLWVLDHLVNRFQRCESVIEKGRLFKDIAVACHFARRDGLIDDSFCETYDFLKKIEPTEWKIKERQEAKK